MERQWDADILDYVRAERVRLGVRTLQRICTIAILERTERTASVGNDVESAGVAGVLNDRSGDFGAYAEVARSLPCDGCGARWRDIHLVRCSGTNIAGVVCKKCAGKCAFCGLIWDSRSLYAGNSIEHRLLRTRDFRLAHLGCYRSRYGGTPVVSAEQGYSGHHHTVLDRKFGRYHLQLKYNSRHIRLSIRIKSHVFHWFLCPDDDLAVMTNPTILWGAIPRHHITRMIRIRWDGEYRIESYIDAVLSESASYSSPPDGELAQKLPDVSQVESAGA